MHSSPLLLIWQWRPPLDCVCVYIYVYIHTYIYIHIHTRALPHEFWFDGEGFLSTLCMRVCIYIYISAPTNVRCYIALYIYIYIYICKCMNCIYTHTYLKQGDLYLKGPYRWTEGCCKGALLSIELCICAYTHVYIYTQFTYIHIP